MHAVGGCFVNVFVGIGMCVCVWQKEGRKRNNQMKKMSVAVAASSSTQQACNRSLPLGKDWHIWAHFTHRTRGTYKCTSPTCLCGFVEGGKTDKQPPQPLPSPKRGSLISPRASSNLVGTRRERVEPRRMSNFGGG
jgi:hypothetical protein